MKRYSAAFMIVLSIFICSQHIKAQANSVPKPVDFFGFYPGSDRNLFDYEKLISYLQKLDEASDRVKMLPIGKSPMGRTMYAVFISSEANIKNLDQLKAINKRLALDTAIPKSELTNIVKDGKVFLMATLSMHSDEVGPTQSSPLIAYELATTTDPEKLAWLDNVVFMLIPSHNPDGMDMVVNHYIKYKGTKNEGSDLPAVYHKYVGHDNNRDFVCLTQDDTKAIAALYNKDWFPQVFIEKHQMGSTDVRYYVPPPHDPIAENVDGELWNWMWIFGSGMAKDMGSAGLKGVSQHYLFDDYWPGSTETCIWKNVIGLLTECASAHVATPYYIEPNELRVGGKGLAEYKKGINMTEPWPGGWWKLSDIVQYEIVSTFSLLKTSSLNREEILNFRNALCVREVKKGTNTPPFYYILPINQHDQGELVSLVNLLDEHGIKCYSLPSETNIEGRNFHAGDIVIPLAQPFRAFIKEVMETQAFPARHYMPIGEVIRPYDVASWSLPLHKGLQSFEISSTNKLAVTLLPVSIPFSLNRVPINTSNTWLLPSTNNDSYSLAFHCVQAGIKVIRNKTAFQIGDTLIPAMSFIIQPGGNSKINEIFATASVTPQQIPAEIKTETVELKLPRIGLIETNFHDMDAGWVRFLFDSYGLHYTILRPSEISKAKLQEQFDVLVFPDQDKTIIMEGKYKAGEEMIISEYPAEFTKGIGKDGLDNILKFLNGGGKIVSWGGSAGLFIGPLSIKISETEKEEFQLPLRDVSEILKKEGLYCPGSLVNINLVTGSPLTIGMEDKAKVFFQGDKVFNSYPPMFDMDRRNIATFPETKILASGYCEKEEKLANKTAMMWIKKGKGQLVLFAFNPIFRASVPGSYKLLFNALLLE
jgi:hypothetical protein